MKFQAYWLCLFYYRDSRSSLSFLPKSREWSTGVPRQRLFNSQ